ncbi:MAG: ABC transporter ATP-binding protein [Myxococcaceae bacterium]
MTKRGYLTLNPSPATGEGLGNQNNFPSPLGGEGSGVRFQIRVTNLNKNFKNVSALNGVSFDFKPGSMHGIIGPEGAGKTTLMRLLLGLLKPSSGQIEFIQNNNVIDFESIRSQIAYMPQQQSLYADLSIAEHLDFFKELYGIPKDSYLQKRQELLHMMRLTDFADRPAGKLSGGMYKKLGLMCALLRSPQIILLDEPTNGVDPISRREFWDLLYRLADRDILILLTTAYMDEAERCGHVHLLESGIVIADGEPRHLLESAGAKNFDELFLRR